MNYKLKMVNKEQILEKLKEVIDPELNINIVDLGLIYDINIGDGEVKITMTLTSPGCPLSGFFTEEVESKIKTLTDAERVLVELVYDPPWTPARMTEISRKQLGFNTSS